jgi:hypothetical protein
MKACNLWSWTKCKSNEGCQHSRNAAAPCLWCLPSGMSSVLFFLSLGKVRPILALVCWRPLCMGFAAALSHRLQYSFVSLSYLSRPSSHSGRIVGSQPLSFVLAPTSLWIKLQWGCRWSPTLFRCCRALSLLRLLAHHHTTAWRVWNLFL